MVAWVTICEQKELFGVGSVATENKKVFNLGGGIGGAPGVGKCRNANSLFE